MRKADLTIGGEYIIQDGSRPDGTRVRVRGLLKGARATVEILDPASVTSRWRKGAVVDVAIQTITCPVDEWPVFQAAARERKEAGGREYDQWLEQRRHGEVPDPARPLPDRYGDGQLFTERDYDLDLADAINRDAAPWEDETLHVLLDLLPKAVQRDVVAAALTDPDDVARPDPAAVVTVFAEAANLASSTYHRRHTIGFREVQDLIQRRDPFVHACLDAVRGDGEELALPTVPRVRVDERRTLTTHAPALGWLRLAYGPTSGRTYHHPQCTALRSGAMSSHTAPTAPYWSYISTLTRPCIRCGGPGLLVTNALVAFAAAAAVWDARPEPLERWQTVTVQHLVADAAQVRARQWEADLTLQARILDGLADDLPGADGWDAYALIDPLASSPPDGAARMAAQQLAYRRLRTLHDILPVSLRPEVPLPLSAAATEGRLVGDDKAITDALRSWWGRLSTAADIPDLTLAVFGLPGADRW